MTDNPTWADVEAARHLMLSIRTRLGGFCRGSWEAVVHKDVCDAVDSLDRAILRQPPAGEVVAWQVVTPDGKSFSNWSKEHDRYAQIEAMNRGDGYKVRPLYASPPVQAEQTITVKHIADRNRELTAENAELRAALEKARPFIGYEAWVPEILDQADAALAKSQKAGGAIDNGDQVTTMKAKHDGR